MKQNNRYAVVRHAEDREIELVLVSAQSEAAAKRKALAELRKELKADGEAGRDCWIDSVLLIPDEATVKVVVSGGAMQSAYATSEKVKVELLDEDNMIAEGMGEEARETTINDETAGLYLVW